MYAQGLPYLFGIHTSSDLYTRQLLKAAAQEGVVESVSILSNRDVPFTNSTCAAAAVFAAQFGLRIAVQESYGAAQAADPAVFDAFALKAAAGGPSLVLGCTLVQDGYLLVEALVRHEVPSQDTFITVMPATAAAVTKLGANTSRYLLSATQWHTGCAVCVCVCVCMRVCACVCGCVLCVALGPLARPSARLQQRAPLPAPGSPTPTFLRSPWRSMGGLSSDLYRDTFFGTAAVRPLGSSAQPASGEPRAPWQ